MSKVLYIKANTTSPEKSRTFRISDHFVQEYRRANPNDEVITLDLCKEDIKLPTENEVNSIMIPKTEESRNNPVLKYAYQFAESDKYIIAEPMWNLSIPAMLKNYIDYVTVSGITFKYTEHGAVGLLQGKKAINIITRGGDFSHEPLKSFLMDDKYLRVVFGFMGIRDFVTITAERLDVIGEDIEAIIQRAVSEAGEIAKTF
ncbi:MAG: NAD(P)H-dependent oxidoreductase [Clostridia bacterium]|nr:NAD(P)H-dependent oxidoreductase [Clostridia bacterium]